jgi:hypothetical protein
MSRAPPTLARLERWMQAVVIHPAGAETGVQSAAARALLPRAARDLESVVLPSRSQSSLERLGIYAHMYYARLLEVMTAEYPTTRRLLGHEAFERACRRYIERHPSTERTLQRLSAGFPAFLSRHLPAGPRSELAVDLARIERAMEDVFDAPLAQPLRHEQLAAIGTDEWQRVRLKLNPALRLLALRTAANEHMNSARGGGRARVPPARRSHVVVHRHRYQVHRRTLDRAQFELLWSLSEGKTLAAAVKVGLRHCPGDPTRLGPKLGRWFRDWTAAGLFCGVERRAPPSARPVADTP